MNKSKGFKGRTRIFFRGDFDMAASEQLESTILVEAMFKRWLTSQTTEDQRIALLLESRRNYREVMEIAGISKRKYYKTQKRLHNSFKLFFSK